jgi:predicted acyltransferase
VSKENKILKQRLSSLDVLRGFSMFWIAGAEKIADTFYQTGLPGAKILTSQLNHRKWIGFTFYDLIYPMFIFAVGVSSTLSIRRRVEKGEPHSKILKHILIRTLLLFLLGFWLCNFGLNLHGLLSHPRIFGVLQRIALCYAGSALLVLYTKPKYQAIICGFLLVGYWILLRFIPVPGYGTGVWNPPEGNWASYFDRLFLPGRRYYGTWDVEGLLSTFPALSTCLIGVLSGYWLREDHQYKGKRLTPENKALLLGIAGAILLGSGLLWGVDFPIIKKIWTSSYAILSGGFSVLGLALLYFVIDVKGHSKWSIIFMVFGLNSILVYLISNIKPFDELLNWVTGHALQNWLGPIGALVTVILGFLIEWLMLYWMYKRKIFLRL